MSSCKSGSEAASENVVKNDTNLYQYKKIWKLLEERGVDNHVLLFIRI
jgi:hypothetical protein